MLREGRASDAAPLSALLQRLVHEAYPDGNPRDVAAWAAMAYGEQAVRDRIERDDCLLLVCTDQRGQLHGATYVERRDGPHGTDSLLGGTYLTPAARGQGLMVDAYAQVVEWLQARGARRVLAYVHAGNPRGRRMLEVVGFEHRADAPGALIPGLLWWQLTAEVPLLEPDDDGPEYWIVPA